ncbi:AraC family transcriptional regulator [Chlorogloeopsis fritschii PCC 9212]|uniref:AraC family transcriptional regulator n=1 Tax=Chlorogloeopsis fritschii PCC 6912 TaxID=211165 RepID=A0A3S0XYY1_CHLFR|nr:AraC family transcriptional regulator [Chlorogloeopsis fritschii]RUR72811.1 AraC family transcriptional regulator [Chlorogloeopsis fritschii PCC 6912]
MPSAEPQIINFGKSDSWQQVLPLAPVLSSHTAAWKGIHFEYHRQPVHETPEYCFPVHTISIGLRYEAREFKANRRVYKDFCPGNIAICPAYESLSTQAYGNAEFMLLSLDPNLLALVTDGSQSVDQIEIVSQVFGVDPLIYHMGLELKRELECAELDSHLYAESMATALATHLVRRYATRNRAIKNYFGGLPAYKLKTAIAYIHEHLDQPLSLAEIAALVNMSPHYFASLFKQSTGVAPYQYVTQCRIERAKQLLTQSEFTIVEVCHQVGFQSQSHFTKVFRDYTKVTPKAYRNSRA